MTNININHKNATIELNKATAKATSVFGSQAYNDLVAARNDFPSYRVVVKTTKKTSDGFKGMNFDFMKEYISKHKNADARLAEFQKLCDAKLSYGEIKQWFLKEYPIFQKCQTRADWILAA